MLPYPASPCRPTTTSRPHLWSGISSRGRHRSTRRGISTSAASTCSSSRSEFGTPLFVYDEDHLRHACREAVAAWGDGVAYATKAFLCLAMARLAHEEGMHLDVASGGELHVALAAGVPPERLILHGNNKSVDELATALGWASAGSSSTRSTRSLAWAACWSPCHRDRTGRRSWCGSRPGSRRTRTSSCGPGRRTRSSDSPSLLELRPRPLPRSSSCPASSWPASMHTSAARSSTHPPSSRRPR